MAMSRAICALLAAAMVLGSAVGERGRHLLTNIPGELPGVTVYHMFPKIQHASQIHSGETVQVLLTLHNEYVAPINVTYIAGSINSADAARLHFQNFTVLEEKVPVASGADRSFVYSFTPDKSLPSRAFSLALTVFYEDLSNDISGAHAATFFNRTVEILDPPRWVDTEAISMYLTLAAILAVLGYGVFSFLEGVPAFKAYFKKKTGKKGKRVAAPETAPGDKSDYLVGTAHHLSQVKKKRVEDEKARKLA